MAYHVADIRHLDWRRQAFGTRLNFKVEALIFVRDHDLVQSWTSRPGRPGHGDPDGVAYLFAASLLEGWFGPIG